MMENDNPRIRSLLRQALRNKEVGKLAAAEQLYRQILTEAPDNTAAWLGLAQVTADKAEKEKAYQRVLTLDENNDQALAGLAELSGQPLQPENQTDPEIIKVDDKESDSTPIIAKPDQKDTGWELTSSQQMMGEKIQPDMIRQAREVEHLHADESIHDHIAEQVYDPDAELFCYRHPDRSTSLRCYKCSKPICSECTVKTPVGYLCPDCHREAEDTFFNAKKTDYLLVTLVAFPLSLLAGWIVMRLGGGFFFILILLLAGGFVGGVIGRLSKRVIGNRRGRYIPHLVAACVIIGAVIPALGAIFVAIFGNPGALFALIGPGVYLATATGSAFYWAR